MFHIPLLVSKTDPMLYVSKVHTFLLVSKTYNSSYYNGIPSLVQRNQPTSSRLKSTFAWHDATPNPVSKINPAGFALHICVAFERRHMNTTSKTSVAYINSPMKFMYIDKSVRKYEQSSMYSCIGQYIVTVQTV